MFESFYNQLRTERAAVFRVLRQSNCARSCRSVATVRVDHSRSRALAGAGEGCVVAKLYARILRRDGNADPQRPSFESTDTETSLPVAIVDEKLAQMYSAQGELVGKRIRIGGGPWLTIVGVVPNVKNRKLDEDAWPYIYRPYSQWVRRETMLVVRRSVDPSVDHCQLAPGSREARSRASALKREHDPGTRWIVHSLPTRLTNLLLAGFAATALLLALTGIYGVMSLNVANRRNEFGIRLALGAQTIERFANDSGPGIATGSCRCRRWDCWLRLALTRLLKGLLFGISASDPLTFVVIAVLLVGVALLACLIPARRATKVDPLDALRSE